MSVAALSSLMFGLGIGLGIGLPGGFVMGYGFVKRPMTTFVGALLLVGFSLAVMVTSSPEGGYGLEHVGSALGGAIGGGISSNLGIRYAGGLR